MHIESYSLPFICNVIFGQRNSYADVKVSGRTATYLDTVLSSLHCLLHHSIEIRHMRDLELIDLKIM